MGWREGRFYKDRKRMMQCRWGSTVETEVNRGCRMVLWALANKWESADICTPSELRKREREGETRDRKTAGVGVEG